MSSHPDSPSPDVRQRALEKKRNCQVEARSGGMSSRPEPQSPDEQWGVHERQLLRERQQERQHRRRTRLTEEEVRAVQARKMPSNNATDQSLLRRRRAPPRRAALPSTSAIDRALVVRRRRAPPRRAALPSTSAIDRVLVRRRRAPPRCAALLSNNTTEHALLRGARSTAALLARTCQAAHSSTNLTSTRCPPLRCTTPCSTYGKARTCATLTSVRLMVSSCWACCPLWTRGACPTMSTLGAVWRPTCAAWILGSPFALAAAAARPTCLRRSTIRSLGVF
jgi:hypothetical protein